MNWPYLKQSVSRGIEQSDFLLEVSMRCLIKDKAGPVLARSVHEKRYQGKNWSRFHPRPKLSCILLKR